MKKIHPYLKKAFKAVLIILIGMAVLGYFLDREKKKTQTATITQELKRESFDVNEKNLSIPGLSAVDVYGNFEKLGFVIKKQIDAKSAKWVCEEDAQTHNSVVEIYGKTPNEIMTVKATFLNYSDADSDQAGKDFLSYVATIPYEKSTPEIARSWVKKNIGGNVKSKFGEIEFTLFSNARARILEIRKTID